jgi:hypothetical protein
MQAPTVRNLLSHPAVRQALEDAWGDSKVGDPALRHEEGGWVYFDLTTGTVGGQHHDRRLNHQRVEPEQRPRHGLL